jgi:nucleotide-binding universal stress UspA family protein
LKLLIGIDKQRRFEIALRLLQRLGFDRPEWHFAHIVSVKRSESSSDALTGSDAASLLHAYLGESSETAALVSEITTKMAAKVHFIEGSPAKSLLHIADIHEPEIVGLGSVEHGAIGAALVGSIGRAFAISASQSFLVGRGNVNPTGQLRIIFATDHSEYANRALKRLLAWRPSGIEKLVLLTAQDLMETSEIVEHADLDESAKRAGRSHEEHLRLLGEELVRACADAGVPAVTELRGGFISHAIDEAVEEHNAELVAVGSQGHGFIERLLIGSTALHQVVASKHSTLVIRSN